MPRIFLYSLMLLFAGTLSAQNLVKCTDGSSFWIMKGKGKKFAVQLRGDLAESDVPELLNVEETALHYNILNKSEYVKTGGKSDAAVLTKFIKKEGKFLGDAMKPEYQLKKLPSGKTFLLWHHDWKGTDEYVEQQVHATIILDGMIIWLSSPKFTGQEISKVEVFLTETIANVKSVKSTNAKELCEK
ncbi:hypothetical protein [Flavobacterium sp.]|uniref:hypothetical protein n=2 Tax=Flavobacterium sp. TaxID=239 RepID=UPI00403448BA